MRSLRFNVSKPDRKVLRDGIKDGSITALALSTITTAELCVLVLLFALLPFPAPPD